MREAGLGTGAGAGVVRPAGARPPLDAALLLGLARERWGLDVRRWRELGSQQDRNLRLDTDRGRLLLKLSGPTSPEPVLAAQDAVLHHLAGAGTGVRLPEPVPALDGTLRHAVGDGLVVRVLTWVDGEPLGERAHLAPVVLHGLGDVVGRLSAALAAVGHPGLDRVQEWDLRQGAAVVEQLRGDVPAARRRTVAEAAAGAAAALAPLVASLPVQAVHGDATDDNVVGTQGRDGRLVPDGVIDFGDLGLGWRVADLAVACTGALRHADDPFAVLPVVRGFAGHVRLDDAELDALWPLVVLRGAVLVASGEHQVAVDPGNAYAAEAREQEWAILRRALSVPPALMGLAVRRALGRPLPAPLAAAHEEVRRAAPLVDLPAGTRVLDLSPTSALLDEGRWLQERVEDDLVEEALAAGAPAVVLRWGEHRLTRTVPGARDEPATYALHARVRSRRPLPVGAAPPGVPWRVRLEGAGTTDLAVQVVLGPEPPALTTGSRAGAWAALSPDPSPLLGLDVAAPKPDPGLLGRRRAAFTSAQESYYAEPPQVERGWREHLVDVRGRAYVDVVNNVTLLGHGHPRVAAAVARQWRLLNTNSRFHVAAVTELCERLAALAPDPLDTVLLVNSGSEAVDLALRLARAWTGREDVAALREAYHGWTVASDAVSTSALDNPHAAATRPPWVHLLDAPNAYRGRHRGPGSGAAYARDAVQVLDGLAAAGRPPGAFVCEPLLGNAGGLVLPEGYLPAVYDAVRRHGGLCVADEVQVGYGRTGRWFWAFEQHGVVPDVITVAKAMGDGHPLGAVLTRREVAEALAREGSFFSSAGGSTVSCVVGLTVLDVLEEERLQDAARDVGAHLRARLEDLARRHPLVGAVHGTGLYQGVELVRDRATLEPASEEAYAVCERLLELGVVCQPAGDRGNVLKAKPPLCLSRKSADAFVDRLDEVLREGW
ncbi:aminotransferase class III-fold pyridoxal phosphate-dependent enzyme [Vallicoccus soli]|uniref:aminotransferase class III-fold pyridoxal phosphate-dependent enzyme n=1 Tax=Vallicoccus soli TaxID=2339232 RepID=UPI0014031266|nr:aminotransferase class III-fold pyridoxal phosphate-dependent enzyme [Vallicoccus soli]